MKIFRIIILALIICVSVILIGILYSGGFINIAGIRNPRAEPASPVIALCILVPIYRLLKHPASFKEAINQNSLLLVICAVLLLYTANYRMLGASDTVPARHLPLSIIREGNFDLDEFRYLHRSPEMKGLTFTHKHYVSSYPIGAAIFAVPFYFVSAFGRMPGNSWFTLELEKFAASLIVLTSVIILYFTLLRLASRSAALIISVIYALATSSFSVSSQALWQHGASQLCLTAALYCLVRGSKEPIWNSFAGFPAACAVVCRPTDALLIAPIGLYVLFHQTRQFPRFLLCAIPPVLFQLVYNNHYFDDPFRTQFEVAQKDFWSTPLFEGLTNILFSPSRGLFVYSPVLIFAIIGMILTWKKSGTLLLRYLSIGVIANILLYSKFFCWWGGYTYGPRLLADITPILCLFLIETKFLFTKSFFKIAFLILAAFSITAHAIGSYADHMRWNLDLEINEEPEAAWYWTDNQLVNPPKRWWNSIKIQTLKLPTTRSNLELFDAKIWVEPTQNVSVRPSKQLTFDIKLTNTGKAVWLNGYAWENGSVYLVMNLYRNNRLLDRFSAQRKLRYQVLPGESTRYIVEFNTPRTEGKYNLEISLAVTQLDAEMRKKSFYIPVRVQK
jgi:Dolichyl-phosphate-mannose-protein mannosyltransferase